jgi:arsenate reductase-like glutaredoxin family protein
VLALDGQGRFFQAYSEEGGRTWHGYPVRRDLVRRQVPARVLAELRAWIPASGLPVKKWLHTSGQSYRALGKERVDAASDAELEAWLAADGKLVKRPVMVANGRVLMGFREEAWEAALGG